MKSRKHYVGQQANTFTLHQIYCFFLAMQGEPYVILACSLLLHGGMRRAELVALTWRDIEDCGQAGFLVVTIRRSKTDQAGKGHRFLVVGHPDPRLCAVEAYRRYQRQLLQDLGELEGRIFHQQHFGKYTHQHQGYHFPARLTKRCAQFNMLDVDGYTAHSWRRTSATLLADAGAPISLSLFVPYATLLVPLWTHIRLVLPLSCLVPTLWRITLLSFFFYLLLFIRFNFVRDPPTHNTTNMKHTHTTHAPHPRSRSLALFPGVSLMNLKRFGRWHSSAVAEQYIAESGRIKKALSRTLLCPSMPVDAMEAPLEELPQGIDPYALAHAKTPRHWEEDIMEDISGCDDASSDAVSIPQVQVKVEKVTGPIFNPPPTTKVVEVQDSDMEPDGTGTDQPEGPTDEEMLELLVILREIATRGKEDADTPVDEAFRTSSEPALLYPSKMAIGTSRILDAGMTPGRCD